MTDPIPFFRLRSSLFKTITDVERASMLVDTVAHATAEGFAICWDNDPIWSGPIIAESDSFEFSCTIWVRKKQQPKPKGKKKTFYKRSSLISQFLSEHPKLALEQARDYWCANPGSILEIVVRKPAKEGDQ